MSKYGAFILGDPLGPAPGTEKEQKKYRTEFPEDLDSMEEKYVEQPEKSNENGDPKETDIRKEKEDEELREVVNAGLQEMEQMMNTMRNASDELRKSVEIVEDSNEEAEKKEDDCQILNGIEERVKNAEQDISKSVEPTFIEKMAESTKEKISTAADYVRNVVQ